MRVSSVASVASVPSRYPTAQALLGESATTPRSSLSWRPGLGLGTMLHPVPSQCWINVLLGSVPSCVTPTAQTSLGEVPDTACSTLKESVPGFGLGTIFQVAPSK